MKNKAGAYFNLSDFQGGINNWVNPKFLQNQVADADNVLFDEKVGTIAKLKGNTLVNSSLPTNLIPIRGITYTKSNGEKYVVICVKQISDNTYRVYSSKYGTATWVKLQISGNDIAFTIDCNFAVFEDILWITSGVDVPVVWNGVEAKYLNGVGFDYKSQPIANFDFATGVGIQFGRYIVVHKNSIFCANTVENGSEIKFSRFLDDDANLINATESLAWIDINQLLIDTANGNSITGIVSYFGNLVVFKQDALYLIAGDVPSFSIIKIPTDRGTLFSDSIIIHNNLIMYLSSDGIYAFDGSTVKRISDNVKEYFSFLSQFSTNFRRQTITDYFDWFNKGTTKTNLKLLGTSENSINNPINIYIEDNDDMSINLNSKDKLSFSDSGLILDYATPIIVYSKIVNYSKRDSDSRDTDTDLAKIYDGDLLTGFFCKASASSTSYNHTSGISGLINLTLPSPLTVNNITLTYRIRQSASVKYSGEKTHAQIMRKISIYKDGVLFNRNFEDYTYYNKQTTIGGQEEVYRTVVIPVNTSATTLGISFYCFAQAFSLGVANQEFDTFLTFELLEVTLKYAGIHETTGAYITNWFDLENAAGLSASTFDWTETKPVGTNIVGYYTLADVDTLSTSDSAIVWTAITNGATPVITKRYISYKFVLSTASPFTDTPILLTAKQNFNKTSQWIGSFDAVTEIIFKWGRFYPVFSLNGGTINFYASPNGITWTAIQPGQDLSTILSPSNLTCYIKIDMVRGTGDTENPSVLSIAITYFTSTGVEEHIITSATFEGRAYWSFNKPGSTATYPDRLLILNKTLVWSKADNKYLTCLIPYENKLYGFELKTLPAKMYSMFDNNTRDFIASVKTKTIILGQPQDEILLRNIWFFIDNTMLDSNINFTFKVYRDANPLNVTTYTINYNNKQANPPQLNIGIKCREVYFEIIDNDSTKDFGIVGFDIFARILRTISKYY